MKKGKMIKLLNASILSLCGGLMIINSLSSVESLIVKADGTKDVISSSSTEDWFQTEAGEGQGTWNANNGVVSVDAFGGAYAIEGATYLTKQGTALGAFEYSTNIKVTELNNVQNPMVGIIPWYLDDDNYLYVQLKFTDDSKYLLSAEEKADGYAIEQIIVSGKYNGEAKYYTATSQQENTTYDALNIPALKSAKTAPKVAAGHNLKVKFENNSATATCYNITISYNDVVIGTTSAYYYNAIAKNLSTGFMAQDVKAEFSNAVINDYTATNNNVVLARDWKENNGFTYRTLNGVDVWTFNEDESVSFKTDAVKPEGESKVKSEYGVSGSNIAGYDTNRGFVVNPYKENENGLPQNYELSASFKLDEVPTYAGKKTAHGYGLLAWYKDDQNFVDVTFRRSVSGTKLSPKVVNEIVLFGWIECSSSTIGKNVYTLPEDFDLTANHTLRVQKKSTGFYVYLDDIKEPILSKNIKGTETNYYYGYEGYNAKYTASKLTSKPIYESYDEISVLDDNGVPFRVSAKTADSWKFGNGKISLDAKQEGENLTARSYLLGTSDISDKNMTIQITADVELGTASFAELMLSPYVVDENNYARIGLAWKDGKTYARVRACTYTEEDMDEDREPSITLYETEINAVDLSKAITLKAEKIENTLSLYVNDSLVYGKVIKDINVKSEDYGIYVYNMDIKINEVKTIGYKKYEPAMVGDWLTSGMKYNEWTIDENGYLSGDGTYTDDMIKEDEDGARNFAIKENPYRTNYEITVTLKATAQSEAEDRLGVVMWYLDENNFMLFYIDHWRSDSTVPRTTIYGKLNGETLPTTYNHGGWFAEGEHVLANGMTQTEASQVTNWHTIKIVKTGNNFTCYVDTESNGYISYTVAAGLPSIEGKTVYSGVYTYNDAVLFSEYTLTEIDGYTAASTPCEPNKPYNASIEAPTLPAYNENSYEDEFDGITGGDNGNEDPGDNPSDQPSDEPSDVPSDVPSTEPVEPSEPKKGCKGSTSGLIGLITLLGGCFILRKKQK